MAYDETLEEELKRILDEGSASAQPMELADEKARLAQLGAGMTEGMGEDLPRGTKVNFTPEAVTPTASRVPMTPKVVDLTQQSPDDIELAAARAEDRMARSREAFERGSRQLVAGLTRTQEQAAFKQPQDAVAQLLARRKSKGEDAQRNEQNRLGAAKFNYDQSETARKTAEEKAKDERDFGYRKEHDAATLKQQALHDKAMEDMARTGLGVRREEKTDREAARREAEVRDLAAKVGDSPAMVAEKAARLSEALSKYKDGELPGFGRATSILPDAVVSDEGRDIRSDARELVNTLLFLQSGAGVTNTERQNKYNAYGLGAGSSESAFRTGFSKLQNDLAKALQAKQAGYTPETVNTYKERGGVVPGDISATGQGKTYKAVGPNGKTLVWDGAKWVPQ